MWQRILRSAGCVSYLGVLAAVFAVVAYTSFSLFVRGGVTSTPELLGLSDQDAVALLADQGLALAWAEDGDRYDDRVPLGHVLLQRPRAGTLLKRGRTVTVVLSRGPQLSLVPNVVGSDLQAAQVQLAAGGLSFGRTLSLFSLGGAPGVVVSQFPRANERIEGDGSVDLFLSLARSGQTFVMPDLVRRSFEEIRRFCAHFGFTLGRVSYERYLGLQPGTVIRQFPLAGHPIRAHDVISLGLATNAIAAEGSATEDGG